MNNDVKQIWIDKLIDGRPQTEGVLERTQIGREEEPIGQCCLGVLCEAAVEAGVELESHVDHTGNRVYTWVDEGYAQDDVAMLPDPVRVWAGLQSDDPDVFDTTLAKINDSGATFADIAAIIELEL